MRAERARRSLAEFARQAWELLEPSTPLRWGWALDAICEHLEAVVLGQIRDLIINEPPGMMKSLATCVFFPAWAWGPKRRPDIRWLFAAYAGQLALRDAVKCRTLIESPWYQEQFVEGEWTLSDDQNAKSFFTNSKTGFRLCTSPTSGTTGHRGDIIVVDDPIDARAAASKAERDAVLLWWDHAMANRLNDQQTGARVVIMQRLHEDDLSGHLLRKGGWTHLRLPMEFEPSSRCITYGRGVGREPTKLWEDPRTEEGELLFPERFPASVVEEEKKGGSARYAGQYQQRPMPAEGGLFKRSWWRFWRRAHEDPIPELEARTVILPDDLDAITLSWDCAFKKTEDSDKIAGGAWGEKGANKFLLDLYWDRATFTTTVQELNAQAERFPLYLEILVEDKANGPAVINVLQGKVARIIAIDPQGGKESRASATSPEVEAGNVFLPLHAKWRDDYIEEHAGFPKASHDDAVDQQSQFLLRVKMRAKPAGHDELPENEFPQTRVAKMSARSVYRDDDDDLDDDLGDVGGGRRI